MAARPLKLSCWLLLLLFAILVHASEKDDPVSVSGSIAARSILQNELLRFTFTIRNRSDIPLESVRLVSVPDSYELRSICVPVSEQPVQCWEGRDFSLPHHALADAVAPGQSITVWGYLKPINTHKTASLAVLVSCRNAATSKESWLAIPLGENQVQDRSEVWLIRVYEFIKVFAIPIALALVGFGLDWIAKRREERREDARRTEEERKNIQQKQALRSETWKQMLPVSHSYSKYYLSLSLASERLASHLRNLNIAVESKRKISFFYALVCQKEMKAMRSSVGAFYFKDLRGETLVAECWRRQRLSLAGSDEDDPFQLALSGAVNRISQTESYASL